MAAFAEDYVDVATRIGLLREKHPDASLQPWDPAKPFEILTVNDKTVVVCVVACYRHAQDERPGVGMAWEVIPGGTPFTRGSELMVCETSARGRAIVAALAADAKASAEEVLLARSRNGDETALVEEQQTREPQPLDRSKLTRSRRKGAGNDSRWTEPDPLPAAIVEMAAAFDKAGITDKQRRLEYCRDTLQREVGSAGDLALDEVIAVTNALALWNIPGQAT